MSSTHASETTRNPDALLPDYASRSRDLQRVTIIGMILDLLLSVAKVVVGVVGHSYALIADGVHSFSDAVSDVLVIVVSRVAHQAPDEDHPYGHGKFETLGTIGLGCFLIAIAGAMIYDSATRLASDQVALAPSWLVLVVAAISVLSKEWIYRYTVRIGRQYRSDLIIANAWHSRTDAMSSVVVLFAAAGAMLGWVWLDLLAAIIVAGMIAWVGFGLAWKSGRELVETAVEDSQLHAMRSTIEQIAGVKGVHYLRGRSVGADVVVDMHLQVDPLISVSEGHYIGLRTTRLLRQTYPAITDITCHIDAEDDGSLATQIATYGNLPTRPEVEAELARLWAHYTAQSDSLSGRPSLPASGQGQASESQSESASESGSGSRSGSELESVRSGVPSEGFAPAGAATSSSALYGNSGHEELPTHDTTLRSTPIRRLGLHYLHGKIDLEIQLAKEDGAASPGNDLPERLRQIDRALNALPWTGKVTYLLAHTVQR